MAEKGLDELTGLERALVAIPLIGILLAVPFSALNQPGGEAVLYLGKVLSSGFTPSDVGPAGRQLRLELSDGRIVVARTSLAAIPLTGDSVLVEEKRRLITRSPDYVVVKKMQ